VINDADPFDGVLPFVRVADELTTVRHTAAAVLVRRILLVFGRSVGGSSSDSPG